VVGLSLIHDLKTLIERYWSTYAVDSVARPAVTAGRYQGTLTSDIICIERYGRDQVYPLSSTGRGGAEKWETIRIVAYAKQDRDAEKVLGQYTGTVEKIIDAKRTAVSGVTLTLISNPLRSEDLLTPPEGFLLDEVHLTGFSVISQ